MTKQVRIVMGANYGDEGKGLLVDYFVKSALAMGESCIVVCSNGGAQRGHTVVSDGIRHVFHHFGSGTLAGAATYIDRYFLVNPIIFREEYQQLEKLGKLPMVYISSACRFVTPFDCMINQMLEESRGSGRHGTCGHGIWETIHRYHAQDDMCSTSLEEILIYGPLFLKSVLRNIRDRFFFPRLAEYGIKNKEMPSAKYRELAMSEGLINHYVDDFFS